MSMRSLMMRTTKKSKEKLEIRKRIMRVRFARLAAMGFEAKCGQSSNNSKKLSPMKLKSLRLWSARSLEWRHPLNRTLRMFIFSPHFSIRYQGCSCLRTINCPNSRQNSEDIRTLMSMLRSTARICH